MKGTTVRVVKGRNVPVGFVGEVFWMGEDKYDRKKTRIGIKDANGSTVWTNDKNVVVVA